MKRTAAEAFAAPAVPVPAGVPAPGFQPGGAAMFDPKAYFAQWQQAAASGQVPVAPAAPSAPAAAVASPANELLQQVQEISAVRCAAIVKEKGDNFTTAVQIEALHTMALKSSYKLREELVKQPHVRRLCLRVVELARKPPQGLALPQLAKAVWSITRFPDDVRGDAQLYLGPAARLLGGAQQTAWNAETASRILWCLARTDAIGPHKQLASQVVREIVRDKGARMAELSHEACIDLLYAIARARVHDHKGDHRTVHLEANDEQLFDFVAKKVIQEVDQISVQLLADLVHTHAEVGLRKEGLFKALCPRLVEGQKELREDVMAKVIKAYTRFMIPLKEEAQGFRTMAVVAKGDFMRPSDKPKRTGKKTFDKPQALFSKTQLHARA
mmetsp:Transcript_138133/g.358826  ORF Transcript_138133/g.358826 Transcript_138133/m.358826 type:complete len:385 (-) Transcript_138133:83-1237(-)